MPVMYEAVEAFMAEIERSSDVVHDASEALYSGSPGVPLASLCKNGTGR